MADPKWKIIVPGATVYRLWPDGSEQSMSIDNPEYLAWLEEGNEPLPADEPAPES